MAVFPLLYTTGFLSFLYFGIYIYSQQRRDKKAQLFLAFCLGFAFWNLAYAALTVSQEQYHVFFQKLGYIGASWYEPFLLLFFIRVTGFDSRINNSGILKPFFIIAFFIFPAISTFQNLFFNRLVEDFPNGFWYLAHQFCSNIYNGTGIVLLILWMRKTDSQREKRQALLLIVGAVFTIILTLITDFLMGMAGLPTLTPFLTIIWGGCIFYAFSRFNFMKTSPLFISKEILTQSPDITILFDRNLKVLYSNRNFVFNRTDISETPSIKEFFEDTESLTEKIKAMNRLELKGFTLPVVLKISPENKSPLNGSFSLIADDYDSFGGILFSGRETISTDQFCEIWGLSPANKKCWA